MRVSAISAAPSGEPCTLSLPAILGEPLPMAVLQQIRVGLSLFLALAIAADTASAS